MFACVNNFVEFIFAATLFFNAFVFIPQAIRLIKVKNSSELSLITFVGFVIMQVFTVWHGYIVKDYILMFGFLLSLFTCGLVTFLIIFYRINQQND